MVFLRILLGNTECNMFARQRFWPTVSDCNCHQSCLFLSACLSLVLLQVKLTVAIAAYHPYILICPDVPLSGCLLCTCPAWISSHEHGHVSACGHSTFLHRFEISLLCEHTERSVLLILCQAQEDSILECYLLACGILVS